MTIQDFYYITVIAEEKNITKAAKRLFISQPSLSQALKKVESELDTTLFIRTAGGLQPTFVGEQFLAHASEILSSYRKLEHFISDVNNLQKGRLTIGIPFYLNGSFLSEILPLFNAQYPGIDVLVTQQSDRGLESLLLQGNADFIIGLPEAVSEKFRKLTILQCRLILSPPPDHPLNAQAIWHEGDRYPSLSPTLLEEETLLEADHANPLYSLTQKFLEASGIHMKTKQLSGYSNEMIRRCSKAGMGFAILPEIMMASRFIGPNENYFYLEGDEDIIYTICVAWPPEGELPPAAKKLLELTRQHFDGK